MLIQIKEGIKVLAICLLGTLYLENSFATQSNQCLHEVVDLRKDFGEIRDQGQLGWCVHYSGADLLTHYIKEKNPIIANIEDYEVSAMAMANIYNQHIYSIDSGKDRSEKLKNYRKLKAMFDRYIGEITPNYEQRLNDLYKKMIVLNRSDPEYNRLQTEDNKVRQEYIRLFEEAKKKFPYEQYEIREDEGAKRSESLKLSIENGIYFQKDIVEDGFDFGQVFNDPQRGLHDTIANPSFCGAIGVAGNLRAMLPSLDMNDMGNIVRSLQTQHPITNAMDVLKQEGEAFFFDKEDKPRVMTGSYRSPGSKYALGKKIEEVLKKKNRPVQIYIEWHNFLNPNNNKEPGNHAVLIVGTQFNCKTKKTEYIIRNSHGKNACKKEKSRKSLSFECDEDGYMIVDKDLLLPHAFGLNWLD